MGSTKYEQNLQQRKKRIEVGLKDWRARLRTGVRGFYFGNRKWYSDVTMRLEGGVEGESAQKTIVVTFPDATEKEPLKRKLSELITMFESTLEEGHGQVPEAMKDLPIMFFAFINGKNEFFQHRSFNFAIRKEEESDENYEHNFQNFLQLFSAEQMLEQFEVKVKWLPSEMLLSGAQTLLNLAAQVPGVAATPISVGLTSVYYISEAVNHIREVQDLFNDARDLMRLVYDYVRPVFEHIQRNRLQPIEKYDEAYLKKLQGVVDSVTAFAEKVFMNKTKATKFFGFCVRGVSSLTEERKKLEDSLTIALRDVIGSQTMTYASIAALNSSELLAANTKYINGITRAREAVGEVLRIPDLPSDAVDRVNGARLYQDSIELKLQEFKIESDEVPIRHLLVHGPPGSGKTYATNIAVRRIMESIAYQDWFDAAFWISFDGVSRRNSVSNKFYDIVKTMASYFVGANVVLQEIVNEHQATRVLIHSLENKKYLLAVDGLEDKEVARVFKNVCQDPTNQCFSIVTSTDENLFPELPENQRCPRPTREDEKELSLSILEEVCGAANVYVAQGKPVYLKNQTANIVATESNAVSPSNSQRTAPQDKRRAASTARIGRKVYPYLEKILMEKVVTVGIVAQIAELRKRDGTEWRKLFESLSDILLVDTSNPTREGLIIAGSLVQFRSQEERERYFRLSVARPDDVLPLEVLSVLWELDIPDRTRDFAQWFVDRHMAQYGRANPQAFTLGMDYGVMQRADGTDEGLILSKWELEALKRRLDETTITSGRNASSYHNILLELYSRRKELEKNRQMSWNSLRLTSQEKTTNPPPWKSYTEADDGGYMMNAVWWHLVGANRVLEAMKLLTNYEYIEKKVDYFNRGDPCHREGSLRFYRDCLRLIQAMKDSSNTPEPKDTKQWPEDILLVAKVVSNAFLDLHKARGALQVQDKDAPRDWSCLASYIASYVRGRTDDPVSRNPLIALMLQSISECFELLHEASSTSRLSSGTGQLILYPVNYFQTTLKGLIVSLPSYDRKIIKIVSTASDEIVVGFENGSLEFFSWTETGKVNWQKWEPPSDTVLVLEDLTAVNMETTQVAVCLRTEHPTSFSLSKYLVTLSGQNIITTLIRSRDGIEKSADVHLPLVSSLVPSNWNSKPFLIHLDEKRKIVCEHLDSMREEQNSNQQSKESSRKEVFLPVAAVEEAYSYLAVRPDGTLLAAATTQGIIQIYRLSVGVELVDSLEDLAGRWIYEMKFIDGGSTLVTASQDQGLKGTTGKTGEAQLTFFSQAGNASAERVFSLIRPHRFSAICERGMGIIAAEYNEEGEGTDLIYYERVEQGQRWDVKARLPAPVAHLLSDTTRMNAVTTASVGERWWVLVGFRNQSLNDEVLLYDIYQAAHKETDLSETAPRGDLNHADSGFGRLRGSHEEEIDFTCFVSDESEMLDLIATVNATNGFVTVRKRSGEKTVIGRLKYPLDSHRGEIKELAAVFSQNGVTVVMKCVVGHPLVGEFVWVGGMTASSATMTPLTSLPVDAIDLHVVGTGDIIAFSRSTEAFRYVSLYHRKEDKVIAENCLRQPVTSFLPVAGDKNLFIVSEQTITQGNEQYWISVNEVREESPAKWSLNNLDRVQVGEKITFMHQFHNSSLTVVSEHAFVTKFFFSNGQLFQDYSKRMTRINGVTSLCAVLGDLFVFSSTGDKLLRLCANSNTGLELKNVFHLNSTAIDLRFSQRGLVVCRFDLPPQNDGGDGGLTTSREELIQSRYAVFEIRRSTCLNEDQLQT